MAVTQKVRSAAAVAALGVVASAAVVGCTTDGSAVPVDKAKDIVGPAGTATRENPASYLSLWNPCTLPKSVTDAAQLEDDRDVAQMPPFQFCNMLHSPDHSGDRGWGINVASTTQSFEQMKRNTSYHNIRDTTVGDGHPAFIADTEGMGAGPGVGIVWGTSYGSVLVDAQAGGGGPQFDVHPLIQRFVSLAYPHIPK